MPLIPPSFSVYQILPLTLWSPLPLTSGPLKSGVLYWKSVFWLSETTFCLWIFGSNGVFKGEDPHHSKSSFSFCALPLLDSVHCEHHSWCLNIQQCDSLAHMDKPTLPPEGVIFKVGCIRWSREWWEGKVRTDLYLHFTLIFISTDLYKGFFF